MDARVVDVAQLDAAGLDVYLDLEQEASGPYGAFVFRAPALARAWARHLLAAGAAEHGSPHGRAYVDARGAVIAMAAWLSGAELKRVRTKGTIALMKFPAFREDPGLAERIRRASTTLLVPAADETYLARIAVSGAARGRGVAREILTAVVDDARARGHTRVVLEVAEDRAPAIALYERFGFVTREVVRAAAIDGAGPVLAYRQMALAL